MQTPGASSKSKTHNLEKSPLLPLDSRDESRDRDHSSKSRRTIGQICVLAFVLFNCYVVATIFRYSSVNGSQSNGVEWKSCGDNYKGYQCANVTGIPLDWHNTSDPRTITIAVTKYLATNTTRQGAIFVNPGGYLNFLTIHHRSRNKVRGTTDPAAAAQASFTEKRKLCQMC